MATNVGDGCHYVKTKSSPYRYLKPCKDLPLWDSPLFWTRLIFRLLAVAIMWLHNFCHWGVRPLKPYPQDKLVSVKRLKIWVTSCDHSTSWGNKVSIVFPWKDFCEIVSSKKLQIKEPLQNLLLSPFCPSFILFDKIFSLFKVDKDKVASIIALALRKQEGTSPVNSHSGGLSSSQDWNNDGSHESDRRSKGSLSITGSNTGIGKRTKMCF